MSAIDQAHTVLRQARSVRQELKRQIHRRGRGTDWLSERGLTKLSGAEPKYWPDLLLKEIVDDALDAAEGVRRPPIVSVTVERDALVVEDTGPGIEERMIRTSTRATKTCTSPRLGG
jgi:signal transduction histidine kinase